jgi:hypothetical protein
MSNMTKSYNIRVYAHGIVGIARALLVGWGVTDNEQEALYRPSGRYSP